MNDKFSALAIIIVLLLSIKASAQYDNFWAFGGGVGIDFNTDPPTSVRTSISTREGSASICDATGQLLFYTDGTQVWDRHHNVMPNGMDLPGIGFNITASTSQGALIVPMPDDSQRYYVFSLGNIEDTFYCGRLYFSIVDMTLNNGLGDVTSHGNLLDSFLTEQMTAVSGDDCDIWLLVSSRSSNVFKAYNINPGGISNQAVISAMMAGGPGYDGGVIGTVQVASNRKKLATARGNLVIYDFDPKLGTISNPLVVDNSPSYYYSTCFSPGNTKLYGGTTTRIFQFDLDESDTNKVKASKIAIANQVFWPRIKAAPDGKIYCTGNQSNILGIIQEPDKVGMACQYAEKGLPVLGSPSLSLPNSVTIVTRKKVFNSKADTAFCINSFSLSALDTSGSNYVWDDGSTGSSRVVDIPGIYWVSYEVSSPCMTDEHVDTFKVVFDSSTKSVYTVTYDSGMCKSDTTLMSASNLNGLDYTWEDGSKGKRRKTNQTGIYWISYRIDSLCTRYIDSFIITYPEEEYKVSFSMDSLVCLTDTILFQNTSDPHFDDFRWSFGDKQDTSILKSPRYVYMEPGHYNIVLTGTIDGICPDTSYQTLIVDPRLDAFFTTDKDSICQGESIIFTREMDMSTITGLHWQMGDGNSFLLPILKSSMLMTAQEQCLCSLLPGSAPVPNLLLKIQYLFLAFPSGSRI